MTEQITDEDLVLVSGASGYIAAHIVKQLQEKGYRVRGTVRSLKDTKKVEPIKKLLNNPKHELELVEADLLDEKSWLEAVKDCTYVIHTASPFPNSEPNDENELIKPAVNGTLFVLKACCQEGSMVKRVVLTSSVAAISGDVPIHDRTYTEKDWSDLSKISAYCKSKTLAEQAAWDFLKEREKNGQPCFKFSCINPGFVLGPLLHDTPCTSAEPIKNLMMRKVPMLPDLYLMAADVRDVAKAHVNALTEEAAVANRHIITTSVETSSLKEWALVLDSEFKNKGYNVPTLVAPNWVVKFFNIFDKTKRLSRFKLPFKINPMLGIQARFDNSRMKNVLKIEPIELKESIIDMAYSLIEKNII